MGKTPFAYGDHSIDDAFCAEGTPAPEQVARKLHWLMDQFAQLVGNKLVPFDDQTSDQLSMAYAVSDELVDHLEGIGTDPVALATQIHETRREFLDLKPWEELPGPERTLGVVITIRVLLWMQKEGSLL